MKFIQLVLAVSISHFAFNQDSNTHTKDKSEVEQVIVSLFQGMQESDSTKVHACFFESSSMKTTFNNSKTNSPGIHTGNLNEFLVAVGTPKEQLWDERISELEIRIDDNLATAWMNYSFYIDDTFSHCGVNAIQFFKSSDGWKITDITDSRRKEKCN